MLCASDFRVEEALGKLSLSIYMEPLQTGIGMVEAYAHLLAQQAAAAVQHGQGAG